MWFDDLLVTYVHDEASPKIIVPLQAQQPLMVVYYVSACLESAWSQGAYPSLATTRVVLHLFDRHEPNSPSQSPQEHLTIFNLSASQSHYCSKSSRWQKPPRVTRKPIAHMIRSATRCLNSKKMHFGSLPNLTKMMNQWRRRVGGVRLGSQGCITGENGQVSLYKLAQALK